MLAEDQFRQRDRHEMLNFSILTDKWSRKRRTPHHVMNKTLQQARMDGIWEPALVHTYHSPFSKLEETRLLSPKYSSECQHDVGVLSVIEDNNKGIIGRDVYVTLR